MTVVSGNVTDVGLSASSGSLVVQSVEFVGLGDDVVVPSPVSFPISDGVVEADLLPGPARLTIHVGSSRKDWYVVIPGSPVGLGTLIESFSEYEPPVVADAIEARNAAQASALAAAGSATAAASSASGAATSRDHAVLYASAANASMNGAATSAMEANGYRQAAAGSAYSSEVARAGAVEAKDAAVVARTAAAGSATTAGGSATAAAGSASTASTKAGEASASATAASGSASTASSRAVQTAADALTLQRRVEAGAYEVGYTAEGEPYLLPPAQVLNVSLTVDNSVGTRVMLGSTMIHGDTGWRNVTALMLNGLSGTVSIRRVGSEVMALIQSLSGMDSVASSTDILTLPDGWRSVQRETQPLTHLTQLGIRPLVWVESAALRITRDAENSATRLTFDSSMAFRGLVRWETSQPWPASLPGTPA